MHFNRMQLPKSVHSFVRYWFCYLETMLVEAHKYASTFRFVLTYFLFGASSTPSRVAWNYWRDGLLDAEKQITSFQLHAPQSQLNSRAGQGSPILISKHFSFISSAGPRPLYRNLSFRTESRKHKFQDLQSTLYLLI